MPMLFRLFVVIFSVFGASAAICSDRANSGLVVSVRPLALIAEELYDGPVEVLLDDAASPHHVSLRPSMLQKIKRAKRVLWLGPDMEPHLAETLKGDRALALLDVVKPDETQDPHIWLDPERVLLIADVIARELSALHPEKKVVFEERLSQFKLGIQSVDEHLREKLADLPPFVVFHDSLGYLVRRYDLEQLAVLTDVPEEQVGGKTLTEVAALKDKAQCLMSEPGEADMAQRYARRLELPLVVVDILAAGFRYPSYKAFLASLGESATACTAGNK